MGRCAGIAVYIGCDHSAIGGSPPSTTPSQGGNLMYQRLLTARDARRNEDGFTLIELLIVIVVLGILAGIVVFGVGTFRKDATTAACKADVKTVSVATDAFNASTGNWPTA